MKKIILILIIITLIISIIFILKSTKFYSQLAGKNNIIYNNYPEKFSVFPIKLEDLARPPVLYGLWPYGIKGDDNNSHNEGHPGWDFELKNGAKLYAIADLTINQIHDGDHQIKNSPPLQVIEANAKLKSGNYNIVYHSVKNLEKNVIVGSKIKAGAILAEAGYPTSDHSVMIHFGIFPPYDSVGACPSNYFSEEHKEIIANLVNNSLNLKTGQPYTSACLGKINKELYLKNFPERVKWLGGAEQWE